MLRYVNARIPGKIAFYEDGAPAPSSLPEGAFEGFLSLHREPEFCGAVTRDYSAFARAYGSLAAPEEALALPGGAQAPTADLAAAGGALALEDEAVWRFHVDAMRDLARLHGFANYERDRRRSSGKRLARGSCLAYRDRSGEAMCAYYSTASLPGRAAPAPKGMPAAEAGFLAAMGPWHVDAEPMAGPEGDGREVERWLAANAERVMRGYLGAYVGCFLAEEGTLLRMLQDELLRVLRGRKAVSFCMVCDAVEPSALEARFQSFCSTNCRYLYYERRAALEAVLSDGCGYTQEQVREFLQGERGKYKKRRPKGAPAADAAEGEGRAADA